MDFVRSPYYNRNAELIELVNWLNTYAPAFENMSREHAHAALFNDGKHDEARLNHIMSFLLKLAEEFLGQELLKKEKYTLALFTLKGLELHGQDKHYGYNLEQLRREFKQENRPGVSHYYHNYSLEIQEAKRFAQSSPRQFNESVQKATDSLDSFYLLEKLRRTCYMYTSQAILATPYNLQLVEEICRFVGANLESLATPAIEAYYRIFQMLTKEKAHEDFQALKNLLALKSDEFSEEDLSDIYQYAINFCNLQILKVQEPYVKETFELYTKGIETGILLDSGTLSPWHFKNIINSSLRLKKYAWTEQFINDNTKLLSPEFQEDALHYNLALLYYHTDRLSDAMYHLNKVEFTDIHYSLGARVMLCQIYYQHDDFDALESLLHAFNTFLRRNKLLANPTRQAYQNFIQILRKVIKEHPQKYPEIIKTIEGMPGLAGKEWLLGVLGRG